MSLRVELSHFAVQQRLAQHGNQLYFNKKKLNEKKCDSIILCLAKRSFRNKAIDKWFSICKNSALTHMSPF